MDGGRDPAPSHPVDYLLRMRPNPEMSAINFKKMMQAHALTWGNAYAEIVNDLAGRPAALWPITPDRVDIKRDESGGLFYEISNQRGPKTNLAPESVFHVAGLGFDGIRGYSVVSLAATSIGAGIASDDFIANFYTNGAVLSGGLKTEHTLKDETYIRLKKSFTEEYAGAQKSWKPIILEQGLEWQEFGMPLKDAEFLASQKFRIEDIARWFNVPLHKIAQLDRATFNNIEHLGIEAVQDTMLPWAITWEQEADYKLISRRSQNLFYTKMNLKGLMRGDDKSRAEYYKDMRNMGAINSNEIRILEDMNPIGPEGDKYIVQGQYTTLDKIGQESAPAQLPAPNLDNGDNDDE
jgi:HK97 family phage portal protein